MSFYDTFPCLVVLASSSKFQSYVYKTKMPKKKLQQDSNIMASPEAGRANCLSYELAQRFPTGGTRLDVKGYEDH